MQLARTQCVLASCEIAQKVIEPFWRSRVGLPGQLPRDICAPPEMLAFRLRWLAVTMSRPWPSNLRNLGGTSALKRHREAPGVHRIAKAQRSGSSAEDEPGSGADGSAPGGPLGHFFCVWTKPKHHCRQAATRTHPPPQQRLPRCPFPLLVRTQCGMIVLGLLVEGGACSATAPAPWCSFST